MAAEFVLVTASRCLDAHCADDCIPPADPIDSSQSTVGLDVLVDLSDVDTLLLNLCCGPPLTVFGSVYKSGNKASREAFIVGCQTLRKIALVSITLDCHEILAELAALGKLVPCHSDDVDVKANRQASRSDASVELAQD